MSPAERCDFTKPRQIKTTYFYIICHDCKQKLKFLKRIIYIKESVIIWPTFIYLCL